MRAIFKVFLVCLFLLNFSGLSASGCKRPEQGPPGPQGSPGTPGTPGGSTAFLSVFTTDVCQSPGCLGVPVHGAVIFEQEAVPPQGLISYDPATGTVTFLTTGFFDVTFGLFIDTPPNANIALQINPAGVYTTIPGFVPGSGIVPGSVLDISFPDQMTFAEVIVDITIPGQTLQVVNVNTASNINLDNQGGIVGFLVVKKL